MAGSGPTVDAALFEEEDFEDTDGLPEGIESWGRLFSLGKGLKGIGELHLYTQGGVSKSIWRLHIIQTWLKMSTLLVDLMRVIIVSKGWAGGITPSSEPSVICTSEFTR